MMMKTPHLIQGRIDSASSNGQNVIMLPMLKALTISLTVSTRNDVTFGTKGQKC